MALLARLAATGAHRAKRSEAAAGLSPTGVRHVAEDSAVQVTERSVIH
jgi:hypothetical protein